MPKVLVAATNDLAPQLEQTLLWSRDVERVFATTPSAAFEVARAFCPSLVVIDGSDPPSAEGLIRRLRDHAGTRRSSIVVVAPAPITGPEKDLTAAGANLVLSGAVEPGRWDARLAELLAVPRRIKTRFPVRFWPGGVSEGDPFTGEACDVSLAGMLFATPRPVPAGTRLALRFTLPWSREWSSAVASVVRLSPGAPAHLGVRFLEFEGDAETRIRTLLASVPPEGTFGRYEPLALLGEGSMGRVYRAFDPLARRVVAIKTPRPEDRSGVDAEAYLRRFRREAQAAGRLVHPNIVTIFDVGDDYFVMELLEGPTLQTVLRGRGHLTPDEVLRLLAPVAAALDFAHAAGTIHRDVKPANIMILTDGRPKVMDFGVAQITSASGSGSGLVLGSPAYMAPERITRNEATPVSDVYSLAVVAYEALTGHKPFEGETVTPVLFRVVNAEPPPPSRWNADLPPEYDDIFRRALAKDPAGRFSTAAALIEALGAGGLGPAIGAPGPVLALPVPAPPTAAAALRAPPAVQEARGPDETLDLDSFHRARLRRLWTALAVAIVAAAAGVVGLGALSLRLPAAPAPPAPGLQITTEPAGAAVWLDGRPVGTSPLLLRGVAPGAHAVKVVAEDFVPSELSVQTTREGPPIMLRFQLQPMTGTLEVESHPEGATVRVDGRDVGIAPIAGLRVSPGARRIEVDRKGHRPWAMTVDVRPGESQHLVANLETSSGGTKGGRGLRSRGWIRAGDLVALTPGVTPPRRIHGTPAAYPEAGRQLQLKGIVTVEFTVTDMGAVVDPRVVESAGETLDRALLEAVRGWRYAPAEANGVRVRVRIRESQSF